ncbi:MAG: mercuric transport protein periplasmic component [Hyphomicrobiales bacterium]|nr:MAG: mercuric transport protein periplasmic component [Hyphomicrobiales bacterium]
MKKILSALMLVCTFVASPTLAVERTINFAVPGMFCASCPFIVEAAMGEVKGVISVTADTETRTALVVYDDEITSTENIAAASESAGYEAKLVKSGS